MTNAGRHTAYKHNSQPVKITGTFNHSVISKSHKIKKGNLVPSKQTVLIFSIYFEFSLREKRKEGGTDNLIPEDSIERSKCPWCALKPTTLTELQHKSFPTAALLHSPSYHTGSSGVKTTFAASSPLSVPTQWMSHRARPFNTSGQLCWRACGTQLLQQWHLPAPSPGLLGQILGSRRTLVAAQKPRQRWQKRSGASGTTEPTAPVWTPPLRINTPGHLPASPPFPPPVQEEVSKYLEQILRLKGLRSLRTSRAKINKNQRLEQLPPCL